MLARALVFLAVVSGTILLARPVDAEPGDKTVEAATEVLKDLVALPVQGIPASLLAEAHGVAIIPNTIKVGLVVGGQRGKGVLIVREKDGSWRAPTFITMKGGSIGLQAGAQGSDVVLVFKTQKSVEGLLNGSFKIGADVAAAAGPIGRRVEAATDSQLKAEIYSYSRSRGLFAGLSIDGSVIQVDRQADAAYYGAVPQGQAFPAAAQKLVVLIAQVAAHHEQPMDPTIGIQGLPVGVTPESQAAANAERIKEQLSRSATPLNAKLDNAWRQYLALPPEAYGDANHPALADLKKAQSRFDAVMSDPRYSALTQLREFRVTRDLLHAYVDALSALRVPKLNLPPPPGSGQR